MQFLAFLKDSFREARNGWVLQAMLILSFLLVLCVASISFKPTSVLEVTQSDMRTQTWSLNFQPGLKGSELLIENYKASNEAEPWNSDYTFDIVVKAANADMMKALDSHREFPISRARAERYINQKFPYLKERKVEKGVDTPTERSFHVTTKGTKASDVTEWIHVPSFFFALEAPIFSVPLRAGVFIVENYLIYWMGTWILLFISIVITAGIIPNFLQKGAIDLVMAKPITRSQLLVYKFIGGLTFTAILAFVTVGGSYIAIGMRTGMWNHYFLVAIPIIIFKFAILYAVSTLFGVLTRNAIVSIIVTLFAWLLLWGFGKINNRIVERKAAEVAAAANPDKAEAPKMPVDGERPDFDAVLVKMDPNAPLWGFIPKSTFPVWQAIHMVLPRISELDDRLGELIARGILTPAQLENESITKLQVAQWPELLIVSTLFIFVLLGIAIWRFHTRDG